MSDHCVQESSARGEKKRLSRMHRILDSRRGALQGGGEMGERIRAFDWSKPPRGPVESWSPALRMMVSFLLANVEQVCRAEGMTPEKYQSSRPRRPCGIATELDAE